MRAVILNPQDLSFPGGAERYAALIGKLLEKRGFSVTFATLRSVPQSADLLVLNGGSGTLLWSGAPWIVRAQRVWVIPHESLFHAALFAYPHLQKEIALILSHFLKHAFNYWKKRKHIYLIAVSSQNSKHLETVFGVKPICLPNGVNVRPEVTVRARSLASQLDGLPWGMIVSRWDWAKNPRVIAQLAKTLPEDMALLMRITPDGIPALRVKVGLDRWPPIQRSNLMWLNYSMPKEELWGLMSLAKFVLVPSAYEAFGYVIVEAASLGVPVFTTPVGVGKEFESDPVLRQLLLRVPPHGSQSPEAVWLQVRSVLFDNAQNKLALQRSLKSFAHSYTLKLWEQSVDALLKETFAERYHV